MTTLGVKRLGVDRYWVNASMMQAVDSGARVSTGTSPTVYDSIELTDGATEGASFMVFPFPDFTKRYTTYIRLYWAPSATDASAHTVRWEVTALKVVAGTNVATAAGTTTTFTGISQANTQNQAVKEARTSVLSVTANETFAIRFTVRRIGGDGADTYVGDVRLFGALVELEG